MNILPTNILYGGYTFLVFFVLHVAVWRFVAKKGVLLLWSLAALVYVVSLAYSFFLLQVPMSSLWGSLFVYAFLGIAYTRFYITLSRTLTLRFLEELLAAPHNTLSNDQFQAIYPPRHAFVIRLRTLVDHGWIVEKNGCFTPTMKCTSVGWVIRTLRQLYGIHNAG